MLVNACGKGVGCGATVVGDEKLADRQVSGARTGDGILWAVIEAGGRDQVDRWIGYGCMREAVIANGLIGWTLDAAILRVGVEIEVGIG